MAKGRLQNGSPNIPALQSKGAVSFVLLAMTICFGSLGYFADLDDWVVRSGASGPERPAKLQSRIVHMNPGETIRLSTFRTLSGATVTLNLVEGTFKSNTIEPDAEWREQGWKSAILVNSVDEEETEAAGISGQVIAGCKPVDKPKDLRRGEVHLRRCSQDAPYRSFGIDRIADVAVVTWRKVGESEPCFDASKPEKMQKAEDCVDESVKNGLAKLFEMLERLPVNERPDALVLPALGTGIGGLPKSRFYQAAIAAFGNETSQPSGYLPPKFYLHEYIGAGPDVSSWTPERLHVDKLDLALHSERNDAAARLRAGVLDRLNSCSSERP